MSVQPEASPAPSTPEPRLVVDDLHAGPVVDAGVAGEPVEILRGVSLAVPAGELHVLMGPNGSGKSTLANVLLANPAYEVRSGRILLDGDDVTAEATDERAKRGLFLGFQYPEELPGVTPLNFLRQAVSARKGFDLSVLEVRLSLMEWMPKLGMDDRFTDRYVNEGFSGGEKKRNEILQMALLEPEVAVLDETDSGLDIDALRVVAQGIAAVRATRPQMAVLLITHYQRILDHLTPDVVHVLLDGRIVATGGPELAREVEREGFEGLRQAHGQAVGAAPAGGGR
jgi:Fe-S cluster assembly ATP-binding protein